MQYNIDYTETEDLAMQYVSVSVDGWIQNMAHQRARQAIDDIVKIAVNKFLEQNIQIPSTKEEIVSAAFDNGWVKTAIQSKQDSMANTNSLSIPEQKPSSNT
jgi:hypothetical protein